ncbi:hypothetical protein TNCV_2845141 [Trichonephila clavipes]|nr:hypothetical protein TNCV_2845141 [Trichonephila clavipes]
MSIRRNRPALLQSFELSSPTKECGTFYEHRTGRYAPEVSEHGLLYISESLRCPLPLLKICPNDPGHPEY